MIIDGQNHWDDLLEPDNSNTNTNLEGDANPDNQNEPTPEPIFDNTNSDPEPKNEDLDVFSEFLKGRGLRDGKTLIYQDEEGNEQEVDFNTLDREEQLNILNELAKPDLTEDEVHTIEYLRNNNLTIQDVVEYYSQKAVQDYINQNGPVNKAYSVDDYSDEELYIADLKSKFEGMTEEEIQADLDLAKSNEDLFKKKVETIRNQYKAQEDKAVEDAQRAQEEQYNAFKSTLEEQLVNFNEISLDYQDEKSDSLQIEDHDKQEIFSYILDQDENGASQFFKDLNDPQVLVELAWYRLFGKDAISGISQYYKSLIKETRKPAAPKNEPPKPSTIIPTNEEKNKSNPDKSIASLWDDEL